MFVLKTIEICYIWIINNQEQSTLEYDQKRQECSKMVISRLNKLNYWLLFVTKSKEFKRIQKPVWKSSHWPNQGQCYHQNNDNNHQIKQNMLNPLPKKKENIEPILLSTLKVWWRMGYTRSFKEPPYKNTYPLQRKKE